MFLIFFLFVLAKKYNYFKSLKYEEDNPIPVSAAAEITHLKRLMIEQRGADFKVRNTCPP